MDPMTDELYEEQKKKGGTVTSAGTPGTVPQQPEVPVMQVNDYSSWLKEMNAAKQQAALAELARSVTLQNNLNAINQQEADTLADSALKRARLCVNGNLTCPWR